MLDSRLQQLSWREFERLLNEAFRRQGYAVSETQAGADGGVDLVIRKNNERTFVQCKHWKTKVIGVGVVRELLGVVTAHNADKGIVVCSGEFTLPAYEFAKKSGIKLISGPGLNRMLDDAPSVTAGRDAHGDTPTRTGAPLCPKCNLSMVKRTAKRGAKIGNEFWGCSDFPKCRGTKPLSVSEVSSP